jgi:hypothetical protein
MAIITLNNNSLSDVTELPAGVGGKVLQVVQATSATITSTTSNSYVTTGLSASITPTSASNKVLIIAVSNVVASISTDVNTTIFRGTVAGTNLASSGSMSYKYNNQASEPSSVTNVFLDSPSTTSATTYTFAFKSTVSGQTSTIQAAAAEGTITLMEIAG